MTTALARIGLVARAETRLFMIALARRLKAEFGSEIHLYCPDATKRVFYAEHGADVFASISVADHLARPHAPSERDAAAEFAEARAWEAAIGTTFNMLAVGHRHFGRGYALGGFHHPRSRLSQETSYLGLVHAYNEALGFWAGEIERKGLTLILNGGRETAVVARSRGVPYRTFAGSRYKNHHYWAWNEFWETPEFEHAYRLGAGQIEPSFDQPIHGYSVNRARFLRRTSASGMLKLMARRVALHFWWRWRGDQKGRGYFLRDDLAYFVRLRRQWRQLRRLARSRLSDLDGQRFVFLPLQTEPEYALQGLSPERFDQLGVVAAVSRDLPAGIRLAVKETYWGIGRRPSDFYAQLAELKNVVLLDPMEPGIECVRKADAVALITGSTGFEAAVLGKPVVSFGRHNMYNFLPHVQVVERDGDLARHLGEALSDGFDAAAARLAGKRFLSAVVSCSFDMRGFDFVRQEAFDERSVVDAADALVRSLAARAGAAEAAAG